MKIIIVGSGLLGAQIARELIAENRDVVIIESNPETARAVDNELDCLVIEGSGEDPASLGQAGAADADWFIALTGSDETNIVACGLVAEFFQGPRTIARVHNSHFGFLHRQKPRFLGVDHVLNPEQETAEAIVRTIDRGLNSESFALKEAGVTLRKITASDDPRFSGRTLKEVRTAIGRDFLVPAIVRDGSLYAPAGDFVFADTDAVYLLGDPDCLNSYFGEDTQPGKRIAFVVLFGAESLSMRLLAALGAESLVPFDLPRRVVSGKRGIISSRARLALIDKDREAIKLISRNFPDVEAICRSVSEENILEEENIDKADLVIAVTSSQTFNIATALLARRSGARSAIALVHNDLYMRLEGSLDIDAMVNQKTVVVGAVLDIVRKADIRRLHSFAEGELELVELSLDRDSRLAGTRVRDLGLPRGILIAFIIRAGGTSIPTGDTTIKAGDTIGVVLSKDRIGKLESLFGA